MARLPRHPASPRPQRHRVIPAPGPTPLGRRTDHVLAVRLPTPAPPLRTQAGTLPRLHRHRRNPHMPPQTDQAKCCLSHVLIFGEHLDLRDVLDQPAQTQLAGGGPLPGLLDGRVHTCRPWARPSRPARYAGRSRYPPWRTGRPSRCDRWSGRRGCSRVRRRRTPSGGRRITPEPHGPPAPVLTAIGAFCLTTLTVHRNCLWHRELKQFLNQPSCRPHGRDVAPVRGNRRRAARR